VRGYLWADMDSYGALKLTDTCRPLLKGEQAIFFRKDIEDKSKSSKSSRSGGKVRQTKVPIAEEDMPLWLQLKTCRKKLADEQNVPAYVVFSDATLQAMVQERPVNKEQMLAVSGIGETKFERFGESFLTVLTSFP
jgi:ATP-dependent DNA helicase RecQ